MILSLGNQNLVALVLHAVARRQFRSLCSESDPTLLVGLTCDAGRERATGIEPAFSAWEAPKEVSRDLRQSGKVQIRVNRTYSLLFAGVPSWS